MNQQELISKFIDDTKMKMNPNLFSRDDDDVINYLMDAIKSCERVSTYFSIKVKGFSVIDDFDEVNRILFEYYERAYRNKTKAKRKDNRYEFINLNESDIRLLIVHYEIADKERTQDLDVIIAVPRIIDKYYFKIDGIMRSTLYQVVDGSTYNNSTSMSKAPSVTMKLVFMAVRVFRRYMDLPLIDGSSVKATYYTAFVFNKTVGALKYILAKYGYYGAMEFLGLTGIYLTEQPVEKEDWYCFKKCDNLFISVPKIIFDNDLITQTFIATVFNSIYEGVPMMEVYKPSYWVRSLGADFNRVIGDKFVDMLMTEDKSTVIDTYDKGASILDSFETIYDLCTYRALRLDERDKCDMYAVLRWMLREFNNLRMKDNLDISNKRIRFAEYVSSLYVMKIAKGIYRVADMNKRASIESIIRAIKTDPLFLLKSIVMSKMISYRNMVSDMDSMQALKFTYKGVSGLGESGNKAIPDSYSMQALKFTYKGASGPGESGNKAIPDIYRSIQPSHIGRVDLDASSDGNPGITGTLNPFMDMDDGYFSDYEEPNTWEELYKDVVDKFHSANNMKQAMEFQEQILGIDRSVEITEFNDIACNMEQIINPITRKLHEGMIFYEAE